MRFISFKKKCWDFLALVLLVALGTTLFSSTQAPIEILTPADSLSCDLHSARLTQDDGPLDNLLAAFFKTIETEMKESESKDSQDFFSPAIHHALSHNVQVRPILPSGNWEPVTPVRLKFYLLFHSLKLDC